MLLQIQIFIYIIFKSQLLELVISIKFYSVFKLSIYLFIDINKIYTQTLQQPTQIQLKLLKNINQIMNFSQSLKPQLFSNLQSTHIPTYASIKNQNHPNQIKITQPYGEKTIPVSSFINRPNPLETHQHINPQQPHHPLPLYTYGHQCQPCTTQPYVLPVYYQEPIRVRQEWQRPLNPNVHQQQWRFVKTQDKGGVVKYVTRDQQMVETIADSKWRGYYTQKKRSLPPVIVPQRETKTCCTPVLFALLGFLALGGLILGLVLLLNAHESKSIQYESHPKVSYVDPSVGPKIAEQFPAIPISTEQRVTITTQPATRPTFTSSITAEPKETVQTKAPTSITSKQETIRVQPVSVSYGYQSASSVNTNGVNYNNDYQVRPSGEQNNNNPGNNNYQSVKGVNPKPQPITSVTPLDVNNNTSKSLKTTAPTEGNYDFRIPEGYKVDENGMITKI